MEYIGDIELDEKLSERQFIIYGTGKIANKIFTYLENNNLQNNVICFCVSDSSFIEGQKFHDKKVEKVSAVCDLTDTVFLVGGGMYAPEMLKTLESLNITKIHILFV